MGPEQRETSVVEWASVFSGIASGGTVAAKLILIDKRVTISGVLGIALVVLAIIALITTFALRRRWRSQADHGFATSPGKGRRSRTILVNVGAVAAFVAGAVSASSQTPGQRTLIQIGPTTSTTSTTTSSTTTSTTSTTTTPAQGTQIETGDVTLGTGLVSGCGSAEWSPTSSSQALFKGKGITSPGSVLQYSQGWRCDDIRAASASAEFELSGLYSRFTIRLGTSDNSVDQPVSYSFKVHGAVIPNGLGTVSKETPDQTMTFSVVGVQVLDLEVQVPLDVTFLYLDPLGFT